MKFHSAAANVLATGAFQKCNWGQIDPMVDRGLTMHKLLVLCLLASSRLGIATADICTFITWHLFCGLPFLPPTLYL